jgi:cytochrome c oxidase subunit 2
MKTKFLLQGLGVAFIVTVGLSGARSAAPQNETPRRIEIVAKRFSFQPAEVTLKKGVPVVLVLTSQDVTHGIKVTEFNIESEIKKDATKEVNFTPVETGDFVSHCSHFCGEGHGSMTLTFHVTE